MAKASKDIAAMTPSVPRDRKTEERHLRTAKERVEKVTGAKAEKLMAQMERDAKRKK
jgi:hypothetical protein